MIYFTADTHFGHERVLEKQFVGRPFSSIEEHDTALIEEINRVVGVKDELYILGDFCWSSAKRKPGHYRQRIACKTVHLIWGNHDLDSYKVHFSTVDDVRILKCRPAYGESYRIFLSHYPHAYWPGSHHGDLHLYGHLHDRREELLEELFPGRRAMEVGVDVARRLTGAYRPFSLEEVCARLRCRPGHDPVSWIEKESP